MTITGKQVQAVLWIALGVALLIIFWGKFLVQLAAGVGGLMAINYGRKLISAPPLWVPFVAWYQTIKEWLEIG